MNREWLARVAASAAIRKVVYIAVAAIIAFIATSFEAKAQVVWSTGMTYCNGSTPGRCDEGRARAECESATATFPSQPDIIAYKYDCQRVVESGPNVIGSFRRRYWQRHVPSGSQDGPWLGDLFKYATTCASRPVVYGGMVAKGPVCSTGCMYDLDTAAEQMQIDQPQSNSIFFGKGGYKPTGETCSTPPTPPKGPAKDDFCTDTIGGHKVCASKDGKTCVISGKTGRKYCWASGQTGPAVDPARTEAFSKSEGTAPGTAPTPPTPRTGEDWKSTSSTSITNTTNNTTTNVAGSNNSGGKGTTPTPGDGSDNSGEEGDGGEGDDKDPGEASGGGTCDAAPTCTGKQVECAILQQQWKARCENKSGDAGNGLGTLYEGSDRTVGDAFGEFQTRIGEAPLIDAGGQFFSVSASGSCPVFSVPATAFWEPLTFDYHCNGDLNSFLLLGGYLVLAVAAFAAFKIAVY